MTGTRYTKTNPTLVLFSIAFFTCASIVFSAKDANSDPCGMVPPVQVNADDAIKRVGAQKTYLFYRNGIESFIVRPGFEGKADNFGMLIPFPNTPSIRKVPNNIFPQLTKAIDPPKITVRIRRARLLARGAAEQSSGADNDEKSLELDRSEVQVKSQEAVGMYQTAVLEAGSAEALKRWMDEHGYSYPNNMDEAANDYVDAGWCFVAVKARVGSKNAVNPKPGMRDADPQMPEDATFDGNVQAMGFRFHSDQLVAPMRLSAYNEGKLHNITYVLTDEPKRINHIDKDKVKRQVSGEQLYKNVTQPLPIRVIGGEWEDLSDRRKKRIQKRRDPEPKNGRAKELFQADLLAARKDRLVHDFERDLKALLDIEEALNLRGEEIDRLNRDYLSDKNKRRRQHALKDLKDMTLTVIDGEFPRDVLKRENLTFSTYRMPSDQNAPSAYNAREKGPVQQDEKGNLYRGRSPEPVQEQNSALHLLLLLLVSLFVTGGIMTSRSLTSENHSTPRAGYTHTNVLLFILALVFVTTSGVSLVAQEIDVDQQIEQLTDREKAPEAVEKLVKNKDASLPILVEIAREGLNIRKRGWAIVALSRIGGDFAHAQLKKIMRDAGEPELVRTLAAAGRIRLLDSAEQMNDITSWINQFPALARPLRIRFQEVGGDSFESDQLLLKLASQNGELQKKLSDQITQLGPKRLTKIMYQTDGTQVRRMAASYLGTLAQQDNLEDVAEAVTNALAFQPEAKDVPWQGGPLFLPRIQWKQVKESHATPLFRNLLSWMIFAKENGQKQDINQIHNNLRSVQLRRAVGVQRQSGQNVTSWLNAWKKAKGESDLKAMLKEQNLLNKKPYKSLVD